MLGVTCAAPGGGGTAGFPGAVGAAGATRGSLGTAGVAAPVLPMGAAGTRGMGSGGMGMTGASGAVAKPAGAAGGAAGKPAMGGTAGKPPLMLGPGQTLPPVTDYSQPGPFATMTMDGVGPNNAFTIFRPTTLGESGFKHPPLTWGNGITTTPQTYPILLSTVASHGFVVIANDSSTVTAQDLLDGLDWLIKQNDVPGEFQGKIDVMRAVTMGYSLGGGAALTAASHPNVVVTVAMHPAPGAGAHAPVLLFTGDADVVVAPALVDASYAGLNVPAMEVSLAGATHFEPVLSGGQELAPSIAWLRLWVYGDQGAKPFFYGDSCTLCKAPWTPQRKNLQ
jgi:hypothetical protein